ncbi:MOSC domain-containing protein [Pseudoduganella albidiflava]|uniref:MOSC domain-containing protein n=2 Tax=Pseudoduganella albidiflava TaxID=321983 RepID=A0AA88C3N7_9BURK|nr:MOSC domain-containing protein [Pseudoduganella albidiflava]GGY47563.1 hypothetical protein GCM10007387_32030 [Pseudoduganella albidiflava]
MRQTAVAAWFPNVAGQNRKAGEGVADAPHRAPHLPVVAGSHVPARSAATLADSPSLPFILLPAPPPSPQLVCPPDLADGGVALGRVQALMVRPSLRDAPRAVPSVDAIAGLGLGGDAHADPLSPRQVLLAGAPAYARHGLPAHALRENLLLDIDTAALLSGSLLRVGPQAVLRLTFACEACGYLDKRQPGVAAAIGRARGMLARVACGGTIGAGDPVVLLPARLPAWDDDWRARVAAVLARVPQGMVIEYRQLARLAGVQPVYCRAFPRLVRKLGLGHVAVPMAGQPEKPRWHGNGLFDAPAP